MNKIDSFWSNLDDAITHDGIVSQFSQKIIDDARKILSVRMKIRKWIPFGSVQCGIGIKGCSDFDFLAIVPIDQLLFNKQPFWAVKRLEANLLDICDENIIGKLDPPSFSLWDRRHPETHIDIVVGISRGSMDSEHPEKVIEELDDEPYFYTGCPTQWWPTSPRAHNVMLNKLDLQTNGLGRKLIKIFKLWKFNNNVPIRTFFMEIFILRWFCNTHKIQGTFGDILETVESMGNKYKPNKIDNISIGIESISKDLLEFIQDRGKEEQIPTLCDPCVYAGWSNVYAYSSDREKYPILEALRDLSLKAGNAVEECKQNENKAIRIWMSILKV